MQLVMIAATQANGSCISTLSTNSFCEDSTIYNTLAALVGSNSRLAHRVIAHVTCLPTKLLGESGQQITLAFLPSGWISVLLLILGPPTFQIT